ncbi:MAG: Xenobiotic-transporting ATPase [Chloroflexi bacterium]|nr:Xenobiotic-transporting ATPase [Chloroflexota bacterium]
MGGDADRVAHTLFLVALMGGVMVLSELLRSLSTWVRTAQSELVQDYVAGLVHERSIAADLAFYEWPEFYDHLHRARQDAGQRPTALLEGTGSLAQNAITLIAMAAVLVPLDPWLPLALVGSMVPALYVVLHHGLRQYHWRLRTTADERRSWYYDWLLTDGETAAELRLFGLGKHFAAAYQAVRLRLRSERVRLVRDQSISEVVAGAFALLVSAAATAWMVWKAAQGLVSLGDLAFFYQAFNQGQKLGRSLLDNVNRVYQSLLFLGNLFEFFDLQPKVVDPEEPELIRKGAAPEIRFRNVTFRYPGSDRVALRDFALTVPAGQIAAIVGPNGAGKSTVIKLLCRLYDPDSGSVEVDGTDVRNLRQEELRQQTSVLFQQPVHYNSTVSENIALGDLTAQPSAAEIEAAARASGAAELIDRLPEGYDTLLGKWFVSGTELSVGEWQRIALARAFLRQAPLILLDEPTSAMDSWAEADWIKRFRSLAAGRTVIIITHRFTTAMRADVIHVMAEGQIDESGRHDELVALGGRYAQSWEGQMSS